MDNLTEERREAIIGFLDYLWTRNSTTSIMLCHSYQGHLDPLSPEEIDMYVTEFLAHYDEEEGA